jgi:colanic acid biosynthesis glycosyl transferase WcaI
VRVLILSQWFHPEPDLKALPLGQELQARGHSVEVLTGFPNYPGGRVYAGYSIRAWRREMIGAIPVHRLMLYPSHDRSAVRRALNYLSFGLAAASIGPAMTFKPDVIYVYNLITLMPAARLMRRLWGAKIVLDIQDLWPESVASSGMLQSGRALSFLRRWSDSSYSAADQIVCLSPGFKRELTARGIPAERIEVIYNWSAGTLGPDPLPGGDGLRAPSRDRFEVLFAGTMGIMQGLDVIVEAARRLRDRAPDVRFTLVGSGVDQERLIRLAEGLENIEFLPRRPAEEVGALLASANALLVHLKDDPLFHVTIPSKIQAYLKAGRPILCGVPGDASDLVECAGAGLSFRPEDPDDLCRAVLALRSMKPDALRDMGEQGQRFYEQELALGRGVDRLEGIFNRLASDGDLR